MSPKRTLFERTIGEVKPLRSLRRVVAGSSLLALLALAPSVPARADGPIDEDNWATTLGRGYDSHLGRIADACVTGHIEHRGARVGKVSAHYDESFSDYLRESGGRLSGSVDLGLIGGSASVEYYAKVARTELSTSYTVRFQADMGRAVLAGRSLTPEGQAAQGMSAEQRRAACGDGFIAEARLGAELLVTASFHFTRASELERFVKTVSVKALFGLIKSKRRWVEETSSFAQSGYLKVEALQKGGDPAQLAAMMGASQTLCRFDAIDPCQALLNSLLNYAASDSGYISQFSDPYRPEELAVLGYKTQRYEDSGHDELVVPPAAPGDADNIQITRQLSLELARQIGFRDRASVLLGTPLSAARRAEVQALKAIAEANISNIERALWVCRTDPSAEECRLARDEEAALRQPILSSDLDF